MENLLITTICRPDLNLFSELTKLAGLNECRIHYSHLSAIGSEISITLQMIGNWSGIAKIEAALPSIAKRLEVEIVYKRATKKRLIATSSPIRSN